MRSDFSLNNNNNILRIKKLVRQRWESNHRQRHSWGFNLAEGLEIKKGQWPKTGAPGAVWPKTDVP